MPPASPRDGWQKDFLEAEAKLTAAAKDLLDEEHSASVADKIKELLK